MSTIYIVTTGTYSDLSIVCCFSTRELAEEYIKQFRPALADIIPGATFSDYEIEERELDGEGAVRPGMRPFSVDITDEGDLVRVEWLPSWSEHAKEGAQRAAIRRPGVPVGGEYIGNQWNVLCWARDEDHAKKIATEMRQAQIASEAIAGKATP